jgi:hypothetical protein
MSWPECSVLKQLENIARDSMRVSDGRGFGSHVKLSSLCVNPPAIV